MDQATAIKQRAQALIQRGSLREAKAEYEKLLGLEPINPYAYILIGDISVRMGANAEALKRYKQGVESYELLGLYRNAIAVLKRLIRLEPGQLNNLRHLADLYGREGLVAEAVSHYLEFTVRRMKDGGANDAREALDAVCRLGIPNTDVAARVSDLLCQVGQPERAARELLKLAADLEARGQADRARMMTLRAENIARDSGLGGLDDLSPARAGREEPSASRLEAVTAEETPAAEGIAVLPGLERAGSIFGPVASSPPSLAAVVGAAGEMSPAGEQPAAADVPPAAVVLLSPEMPMETTGSRDTITFEVGGDRGSPEAAGAGVAAADRQGPRFESSPKDWEHGPPPVEPAGAAALTLDFPPTAAPAEGGPRAEPTPFFDPPLLEGSAIMPEPPPIAETPMIPEGRAAATESLATQRPREISEEVANIFDQFRAGVARQLTGDHAAHYDLGITYMEMGVFSEAISEFRIALEGASYRQRCLELLATCYSRVNQPDLAASHWRAAIQEIGESEGELAMRYELACALEAAGQVEDAREELRRLINRDPSFDAARARLEALGS